MQHKDKMSGKQLLQMQEISESVDDSNGEFGEIDELENAYMHYNDEEEREHSVDNCTEDEDEEDEEDEDDEENVQEEREKEDVQETSEEKEDGDEGRNGEERDVEGGEEDGGKSGGESAGQGDEESLPEESKESIQSKKEVTTSDAADTNDTSINSKEMVAPKNNKNSKKLKSTKAVQKITKKKPKQKKKSPPNKNKKTTEKLSSESRPEQMLPEINPDNQLEYRLLELTQNLRHLYQKKNFQDILITNIEYERNMLENILKSKRYARHFNNPEFHAPMMDELKLSLSCGEMVGTKMNHQQKFGDNKGAKKEIIGSVNQVMDPCFPSDNNFLLSESNAMMNPMNPMNPFNEGGLTSNMRKAQEQNDFFRFSSFPDKSQNVNEELFIREPECVDIREDVKKKEIKKVKGSNKTKRNRNKKGNKSGDVKDVSAPKKYNIRTKYVLDDESKYKMIQFKTIRKKEKKKIEKEPIPKIFENLYKVLIALLFDKEVTQEELDVLSDNELQLLRSFMLKKKMIKQTTNLMITSDAINTFRVVLSKKRVEENLKYVFKFCLKFLKMEFRNKNESFRFRKEDLDLTNKNLIDLGFFIHYFGEIADHLGWPISKFFHPKVLTTYDCKKFANVLDNYEERPKTINKEYVEAVCKSDAFMNDFKNYITDSYLVGNEYTGIIKESKECALEKIKLKIVQWSKLMQNSEDKNKVITKIKNDLEDQNKCKLPWSVPEVKRAVEEAKKMLKMKKVAKRQS
jgi:hypothetical protein